MGETVCPQTLACSSQVGHKATTKALPKPLPHRSQAVLCPGGKQRPLALAGSSHLVQALHSSVG